MSRLTVNSNISALNTQRYLDISTKKLSDTFNRLSSGLRINKASDDAAGLSVAGRLQVDKRIASQGVRNINDGLSALSIADGALEELSSILTRLQELANQGSNGTLGNAQRSSLDSEAQALSKEYTRIIKSTEFNDAELLSGSFGNLSVATGVGTGTNQMISSGFGGAVGDATFLTPKTFSGTSSLMGVVNSDFNGDGNMDLGVVTADQRVNIRLGQGDGTFVSTGVSYATGSTPQDAISGDLNADGFADIVVSDQGANTLSVLYGNGDGSFRSRVSLATGAGPTTISIGDFNDDGSNDLIVADNSTNSISILINNGDGSFKGRISYASTLTPDSTTVADVNNDGVDDVIISAYTSSVMSVYISNGDGSFKARTDSALSFAAGGIVSYDFNGDGNVDIAAATYDGKNNIFLGNGDGSFSAATSYAFDGPVFNDIGDFNGDGFVDIVGTSFSDGAISIMLSNGNGTFKSPLSFNSGAASAYSVRVADFNNDGVADIANGNITAQTVSVHIGNTLSGTASLQPFSLKTSYESLEALEQFDDAFQVLSGQRAKIGAMQSRLVTAISNTESSALEFGAAEGQIMDVDVAEEASRLLATQIVQQAAAGVLAQANLQPRLVLSLLED